MEMTDAIEMELVKARMMKAGFPGDDILEMDEGQCEWKGLSFQLSEKGGIEVFLEEHPLTNSGDGIFWPVKSPEQALAAKEVCDLAMGIPGIIEIRKKLR